MDDLEAVTLVYREPAIIRLARQLNEEAGCVPLNPLSKTFTVFGNGLAKEGVELPVEIAPPPLLPHFHTPSLPELLLDSRDAFIDLHTLLPLRLDPAFQDRDFLD